MFVEFDPTAYNVTERVDDFANLMLVRSGDLSRVTVVTVTTVSGSATGNHHDFKKGYNAPSIL